MTSWRTWGCSSGRPWDNTWHQCHTCWCKYPGSAMSRYRRTKPNLPVIISMLYHIINDKPVSEYWLLFYPPHCCKELYQASRSCNKNNIETMGSSKSFHLVIRQSCVGYISKVRWVPSWFLKTSILTTELVIGNKERPEKHVVPAEYLFTVRSQSLVLLVLKTNRDHKIKRVSLICLRTEV